ncbi:MAG TPA: GspH/FimT family protein [Burkholderiales bacterium]|nr:GspH/FimT family protein [Burkholderiales bacterium]
MLIASTAQPGGRRRGQRGVTLIELMLALVVLAVLLTLGVPSFQAWLQNTQIRTATDALMNGLQMARTEAVRRNTIVYFALETGSNWTVTQFNPKQVLQERRGDEGSQTAVIDSGGRTMVSFSPIGAPMATNPEDGSLPIATINVTSAVTVEAVRPLRIVISPSGAVRMCDPDPNLPAGDPRRCTI